jgi:para-nitrobenzyl esterase
MRVTACQCSFGRTAATSFSGRGSAFEGEALAGHGVVVVTLNYRLGTLGFLAHPTLSRESAHGVSGHA